MSVVERKEREKARRSDDIVDGAERLIFSRGYGNVSMDDIAKELDLARSTLYLYYRNKEEIYATIALRGGRILTRMFDDCCAIGSDGLEKIKLMLLAIIDFSQAYPGYHTAYCSARIPDSFSPEPGELARIHLAHTRIMIDTIHEGIVDGSLRKTIDPMKTSLTLLSSISSTLMFTSMIEATLRDTSLTHEDLMDYSVAMLIHSIKK